MIYKIYDTSQIYDLIEKNLDNLYFNQCSGRSYDTSKSGFISKRSHAC